MKPHGWFLITVVSILATSAWSASDLTKPIADATLVFEERAGFAAIEAEQFYKQTATGKRAWHITTSQSAPDVKLDGDPARVSGASGGAYVECLPNTRRTHGDKLISDENFSNEPGRIAVLHDKVHFNTPGCYYVWARAFSTGSADNGLHVSLDGQWPASGERLQWCEGKNSWRRESKQRTEQEHCGEPEKIFLDVMAPGEHEVLFSMREDGFAFDKFILTTNRQFARPQDGGPIAQVRSGALPTAAAVSGQTRGREGDGSVRVSGELKQWHKVTLTLDGPFAYERDTDPNPFTDYRFVVFEHESVHRVTMCRVTLQPMATRRTRPPRPARNGALTSLPTSRAVGRTTCHSFAGRSGRG